MSHVIVDVIEITPNLYTHPKSKTKSRSRESELVSNQLEDYDYLYGTSQLARTIDRQLRATLKNAHTSIIKVLLLGLGNLAIAMGQARRPKQLAILLAIRDILLEALDVSIQVYALDPSFTRKEESFLESLGIRILRTPCGSQLGEASLTVFSILQH